MRSVRLLAPERDFVLDRPVESERKAVRKCLHHCSVMLLYCVSVECVAKQGLLIRCNCRPKHTVRDDLPHPCSEESDVRSIILAVVESLANRKKPESLLVSRPLGSFVTTGAACSLAPAPRCIALPRARPGQETMLLPMRHPMKVPVAALAVALYGIAKPLQR
jgi:hypothetical protein